MDVAVERDLGCWRDGTNQVVFELLERIAKWLAVARPVSYSVGGSAPVSEQTGVTDPALRQYATRAALKLCRAVVVRPA